MKTCDGSHIDSNVDSFSTEAVINTFNFVCMNGDGKGSLVAKFPGNVAEGSYELTVNPYLYKAKTSAEREKLLTDENGNPVATRKVHRNFRLQRLRCLVNERSHWHPGLDYLAMMTSTRNQK